MTPQDKWKTNSEKVAFLKSFPGFLKTWEEGEGLTLKKCLPFPDGKPYAALVFSNGSFGVTTALQDEPQLVTTGLQLVRPHVESCHPAAFQEYDRLHALDQETGRQVRLENILNAIERNSATIPELKSRIRELVREWDSQGNAQP
jgi:diglucosylglycerate octanoyltransferase